jgi:hypothetical protein
MLSTPDIAMRRVLAAVLGAVIGFDRERHTWGGRTARPHPEPSRSRSMWRCAAAEMARCWVR